MRRCPVSTTEQNVDCSATRSRGPAAGRCSPTTNRCWPPLRMTTAASWTVTTSSMSRPRRQGAGRGLVVGVARCVVRVPPVW